MIEANMPPAAISMGIAQAAEKSATAPIAVATIASVMVAMMDST